MIKSCLFNQVKHACSPLQIEITSKASRRIASVLYREEKSIDARRRRSLVNPCKAKSSPWEGKAELSLEKF